MLKNILFETGLGFRWQNKRLRVQIPQNFLRVEDMESLREVIWSFTKKIRPGFQLTIFLFVGFLFSGNVWVVRLAQAKLWMLGLLEWTKMTQDFKDLFLRIGWRSAGKAVASNTTGLWFESHQL